MLFFWHDVIFDAISISVSPLFVQNGVQKIMTSFFLHHFPSGKSIFIRYGLTIRTKMVMIQQMYEVITRVNYRADRKQFTHRQCKNLDIMPKILV